MKRFYCYATILLLFITGAATAQGNWSFVKDFNEDWLYYDEGWLPVTDRFDTYEAVFFTIKEVQPGNFLLIRYPDEFSLFINKKIYYTAADSLLVNIDSLLSSEKFLDPEIMIYANQLKPNRLRTLLLLQYNPQEEPVPSDVINVLRRKFNSSKDFTAVAFLSLLLLVVLLKTFYPRNLMDFYNIRKTISSRDVEEDFLRGRLFSQVNILVMLFHCMVIGLFILLLSIHLQGYENNINFSFYELIVLWLKYSLYALVFLIFKYILIRNFTTLYNLYNFSTPHFMSYMRMLAIAFGLGVLILYVGIYAGHWQESSTFESALYSAIAFLGLGIFFIFLKLMNFASYKTLHLFSYLCATEILPYVVLLKVAINQSI